MTIELTQEQIDVLTEWQNTVAQVVAFKPTVEKEMTLRKKAMELFFPAAKEGVNSLALPGDWTLKGTAKMDRKIDEAALPAVKEKMIEMEFNPDLLIRNEPVLNTKIYKTLSDELRKVFDHAIIMKPSSPSLELVPPKEKKA